MISAKDRARARDLIEKTELLAKRVGVIDLPSKDDLRSCLVRDAESLRDATTLQILHKVDIDALEPLCSSKTAALSRIYPTIGHLLESDGSASGRPGGVRVAATVMQAAKEVYREASKVTPCFIDGDVKDGGQAGLVKDTVRYENLGPLSEALASYRRSIAGLEGGLGRMRPLASFVRGLFIGRSKREGLIASLDEMEKAQADLRDGVDSLEKGIAEVSGLSEDDCWSMYLAERGRYDGAIEKISGVGVNGPLPSVTVELAVEANDLAIRLEKALKTARGLEIPSEKEEQKHLRQLVREQRERVAQARLSQIDIDVLANGGVRVGPFRTAGYTNLEQLREASVFALTRNKGITSSAASAVKKAVDEIYGSAYESARCKIDVEKKPSHQLPLVKGLYVSSLLAAVRTDHQNVMRELDRLYPHTKGLRADAGYAGNLVTSGPQRKTLVRKLEALRGALPGLEECVEALVEDFKTVQNPSSTKAWKDFSQNAASYYARIEVLGGGTAATAGNLPKALADKVAAFRLNTELMKSTLRGYQKFGAQYALTQRKTLVGDEMGLGKTVEAIAVMAHLAAGRETHFIVVCPLSVLINWVREVPTHSELRALCIHGGDRDVLFDRWCESGGVAVTTYETVSRLDWGRLGDKQIGAAVIDEAHYIKNPNTKRTKAVTSMVLPRSKRLLFLTGTPLENRVEEMNMLLSFLNPTLVQKKLTGSTLVNPIAYREAIAPVYLRRKRTDVLDELPTKVEKKDWCPASGTDLRDYINALDEGNFSTLRRVGWRHGELSKSSKATRLKEICEEAKGGGSKVLVFSYFLETLAMVEKLCGDDCAGVINGRVPAAKRQRMIDEFSRSSKTVLVSQVAAGGVGLNIQAANIVVFCEPQLKPSMEEQAISRSYRMGQVRTVVVHRLLMSDTIDERIEEILARKRAEFDAYADKSKAGQDSLGVVDTVAVIEMIEVERERYKVRDGKAINAKSNSGDE